MIKWLQIWHWEQCGSVDQVATKCHELGVCGVSIKHDDGGRPFRDGESGLATDDTALRGVIDGLKRRGILVSLWGYHYGVGGEADMVERALSFKPHNYILDWEVEFESAWTNREGLRSHLANLRQIRDSVSPTTHLLHQPLPQPLSHQPWQYQAFNAFDLCLPQIYHKAMGYTPGGAVWQSYYELKHVGVSIPIIPWGQVYDVGGQEVVDWALACQRHGALGAGWWKYEDLREDTEEALASLGGQRMRRVNGTHRGWTELAKRRAILSPGQTYKIDVRKEFGLSEYETWATLDLRFAPVLGTERATVVVKDGSGSYAGYLGGDSIWSKAIDVMMDASPNGFINLEVVGGNVRPELVGILRAW